MRSGKASHALNWGGEKKHGHQSRNDLVTHVVDAGKWKTGLQV